MYKYSTTLHSMTHGRGTFRWKSHGYQEVPGDVADKLAAEREKELEAAHA
jgi:translation elongation factor EF-G